MMNKKFYNEFLRLLYIMVKGMDEWKWFTEPSELDFTCQNSSCNFRFSPRLSDKMKKYVQISEGTAIVRHSSFLCPSCLTLYKGVILSVCNHLGKSEDIMFLNVPTILKYGKQIVAS